MKVIIAEHSGVCFGVQRALDIVMEESEKYEYLSTLGPLIHNPQVVENLQKRGVGVVFDVADAKGAIVMPSHGVPYEITEKAIQLGLKVIDATCPFVSKVHNRVRSLAKNGYTVVIVGDSGHSEVKAIKSAADIIAKKEAIVVNSPEEVDAFKWDNLKVGVVSQTTQTLQCFSEVVGKIALHVKEIVAYNTICYATYDRQSAARALAPIVDVVVVVGGRNSANTNRLAQICAESGVPTYHIEKADELKNEWFDGMSTVGMTAGASTPDWIIKEVKKYLEKL